MIFIDHPFDHVAQGREQVARLHWRAREGLARERLQCHDATAKHAI